MSRSSSTACRRKSTRARLCASRSTRSKAANSERYSGMNFSGADRTRQLITVGVGTLLLLVMGGVLIAGFRLATQMNTNVTALQTASVLQTYPNTIASQLNSLRDRLEARGYAGQALADVRATVDRFDRDMK